MLVQGIEERPESVLCGGCFSGFGSVLSVRMHLREREVAEHKTQLIVVEVFRVPLDSCLVRLDADLHREREWFFYRDEVTILAEHIANYRTHDQRAQPGVGGR